MAKAKKIKLGNVIAEKRDDGTMNVYIGLGQKSPSKPEYNTTVEITVRDFRGNVIAKQTDGFIEVSDPRKKPDELLKAGIISEEIHAKMKENVSKLPAKIKNELLIKV